MDRRKNLITAVLVILVVLVLIVVAYVVYMDRQLNTVEVRSFPDDVTLEVDGERYESADRIRLAPGDYTITASKDGFADQALDVTILEGVQDKAVYFELVAESDEAKQWVEDNYEQLQEINQEISQAAVESQRELLEQQPIVEHLPYRNMLFSIGYLRSTPDSFQVTIRAPDVYVPYAINQIEEWGYDPALLDIVYVNQRSPFDA